MIDAPDDPPDYSFRQPKRDLNELIAPGLSERRLRDFRDFLRSIDADGEFNLEWISLKLGEPILRPAYFHGVRDKTGRMTESELRMAGRRCDWFGRRTPRLKAALRQAIAEGKIIVERLMAMGYIEEHGKGALRITNAGVTLRNQKLLPRIPRARAEALLAKVIAAAEAFNADPGPNYYITELYLFGSLLRPEVADVADIDLMYKIDRRYADNWNEREHARVALTRPSGLGELLPSSEREAGQSLRVSPYISTVRHILMVDVLKKHNEPSRLVYRFEGAPASPVA